MIILSPENARPRRTLTTGPGSIDHPALIAALTLPPAAPALPLPQPMSVACSGSAGLRSLVQRRGVAFLSHSRALLRGPAHKVGGACPPCVPCNLRLALASHWCSLLTPPTPPQCLQTARSAPAGRCRPQVAAMASSAAAPAAAPAAAAPAADAKLNRLREAMAKADGGKGIHAFIVPSEDTHMVGARWAVGGGATWAQACIAMLPPLPPLPAFHPLPPAHLCSCAPPPCLPACPQSEYPPDCDARRTYISGFDGSAGTAVICTDSAALWTDGRYFLQAEQQLGPDWTLMRHGTPTCPEVSCAAGMPAGSGGCSCPALPVGAWPALLAVHSACHGAFAAQLLSPGPNSAIPAPTRPPSPPHRRRCTSGWRSTCPRAPAWASTLLSTQSRLLRS